jgi:hypothetical protein
MSGWRGDVDQLLYAGEELQERVGGGPDEIIVTSHRLLALTPDRDGPNFYAVDRPNVEGVELETTGRIGVATTGAKGFLAGLGSILVGILVDFDGLASAIPTAGTDASAAGGLVSMLDTLRVAIGLLDTVLLAVGGVLAVASVIAIAVYWVTRKRDLRIAVAGDDDVRLSDDSFSETDLGRIETALERE